MFSVRCSLIGASLILATSSTVQAGNLRFTIEAPWVQESKVTGHDLYTETFDGFTPGTPTVPVSSAIGDYDGANFEIRGQDAFGGAGVPASGTPQYARTAEPGYTLSNFSAGGSSGPVGYFGFWWSAGNGNNQIIVNMADSSNQTFSTQAIIDSPNLQGSPAAYQSSPDGHYGNPNGPLPETPSGGTSGYNSGEVYAFVNIYALDAGSKITDIQFREAPGGAGSFESDNHTISFDLIPSDNQTGENLVPLPATVLLLGAGIGLIGWTRRRRRG